LLNHALFELYASKLKKVFYIISLGFARYESLQQVQTNLTHSETLKPPVPSPPNWLRQFVPSR